MKYREWLLTNGLGDYSLGTSLGNVFHPRQALFVAVWRPPLQRKILVRQLHESIRYAGRWRPLSLEADESAYRPVLDFRLVDRLPVFSYRFEESVLRKTIWMVPQEQAVYVQYTWEGEACDTLLRVGPLIPISAGQLEKATAESQFRYNPCGFSFKPDKEEDRWLYCTFDRQTEFTFVNSWRVSDLQDELCYLPGILELSLQPGDRATLRLALNIPEPFQGDEKLATCHDHQKNLIAALPDDLGDDTLRAFVPAAHQFLVRRATTVSRKNQTILSGYPDQADHGREMLIALPGILLLSGQFEHARQVLLTLKAHALHEIIPGRFPATPEDPDYTGFDTSLWYCIAVYEYWQATNDQEVLKEEYPFLIQILNAFVHGTDHGVQMDPSDSLLFNRWDSSARTWMDRRLAHWEATPRIGKPVEIQALWYNALKMLNEFSAVLEKPSGEKRTAELASRVEEAIREKFWLHDQGCLVDCLGREADPGIRPNQVIAAGLPYNPFTDTQTRRIVECVDRHLLTPFGLRTLSPDHPAYCGHPGENAEERASAWHNGVVHPWLVLPYVRAALRSGKDAADLILQFEPLWRCVEEGIVGHIPEAFEGDPPHRPLGSPASSLSLGAAMQAYAVLRNLLS